MGSMDGYLQALSLVAILILAPMTIHLIIHKEENTVFVFVETEIEDDDDEIERIIDQIISEHPDQVSAYKGGKDKLFGFFVGQIMKATQGKANPASANKILKDKLDN